MLVEIVLSWDAYQERSISNFPIRRVWQLWLHFRFKFATSLGIQKGKMRIRVCSLQFIEEKTTGEGGESFKAQLFLCKDM